MNSRALRMLVAGFLCVPGVVTLSRMSSSAAAGTLETVVTAPEAAAASVAAPAVKASVSSAIDDDVIEASGVSEDVLQMALGAVACATSSGRIQAPPTLTLIDYSRPSVEPRLWVFDLNSGEMLYKELVAHGRHTGENRSTHFSDAMNSHQSSIGLFVTGDTYMGSNGYSLRLDGLEPGFNGRARDRAIVMHGAPYVSAEIAAKQGRLGRSWGCPAVREAVARRVIDTVRGGGVIFSYYPDSTWLKTSRFLNCA